LDFRATGLSRKAMEAKPELFLISDF
jgi:hypothetical protein